MLMIGSPGTGKTMLARRLPTILPPLTPAESLETTRIYSALGRLKADEPLLATRPFHPPHHTIRSLGTFLKCDTKLSLLLCRVALQRRHLPFCRQYPIGTGVVGNRGV